MMVFVVMVFVMTMARIPARAVLPWSFKTGEIREISAIVKFIRAVQRANGID